MNLPQLYDLITTDDFTIVIVELESGVDEAIVKFFPNDEQAQVWIETQLQGTVH